MSRSLSTRIADGQAVIGGSPIADLIDAVVQMTHRLHDICADHGDDSRQADDLRAQRRRVKAEIVRRET